MQRPKGVLSEVEGNKANFRSAKTNASTVAAKVYENEPPLHHSQKQTQTKPIPQRNTRYATRNTKIKPKRTQFQNRQNEDKYSKNKGLC